MSTLAGLQIRPLGALAVLEVDVEAPRLVRSEVGQHRPVLARGATRADPSADGVTTHGEMVDAKEVPR